MPQLKTPIACVTERHFFTLERSRELKFLDWHFYMATDSAFINIVTLCYSATAIIIFNIACSYWNKCCHINLKTILVKNSDESSQMNHHMKIYSSMNPLMPYTTCISTTNNLHACILRACNDSKHRYSIFLLQCVISLICNCIKLVKTFCWYLVEYIAWDTVVIRWKYVRVLTII